MQALRRLLNLLVARLGALLILFGLGLLAVGGAVQAARVWRVARAERTIEAPDFATTLRSAPAPMGPPATAPAGPDAGRAEPADAGPTPTPAPLPDRIVIPAIKLDRRVVEIGWTTELVDNDTLRRQWETARHAAGFHRQSAPPGQVGNTVISGHNNIDGAVFAALHTLAPGDRVELYAGAARHVYRVERNFIVREAGATQDQRLENALWIGPTPDERLTLVTCYPPWGNTHRAIVIARPVPDDAPAAPPGAARR